MPFLLNGLVLVSVGKERCSIHYRLEWDWQDERMYGSMFERVFLVERKSKEHRERTQRKSKKSLTQRHEGKFRDTACCASDSIVKLYFHIKRSVSTYCPLFIRL